MCRVYYFRVFVRFVKFPRLPDLEAASSRAADTIMRVAFTIVTATMLSIASSFSLKAPQLDRRTLLAACVPAAFVSPLPAFADAPLLTPSAMLTAGQYLNDIKAARRGLDDVAPLIVRDSTEGFEAARITIRKEPVNGIRKACSKIIMLLPEGSAGRKEKDKIYESIKKNLETLDNGMRPEAKERPDNLALLKTVQMELDAFSEGLGIAAADPPAPPPPPPPAAAAPPPTTTADEDLAALRARLAELNALQSQ